MRKFKDYYDVLGIPQRSHVRVIEETYWAEAHRLKRQPTKRAARRLKAINEAYEILGTPHLRLRYDQGLRERQRVVRPASPSGWWSLLTGMLVRPFRSG